MNTQTGYSSSQIVLHWATAILVGFNYIYSEGMGEALDARLEGGAPPTLEILPQLHVWAGIAVLVLVLLRLVLRATQGAPEAAGEGLSGLAATWGHRLLYLLLLAVPVLGLTTWFGGIDATGEPHALLANVIMIVAGAHALVAIFHQFVLKDGVLTRMFKAR